MEAWRTFGTLLMVTPSVILFYCGPISKNLMRPTTKSGQSEIRRSQEVIYHVADMEAAPPEWKIDEVRLLASVSTVAAGSNTLVHGQTILQEKRAAEIYDEVGHSSLERLFPGFTEDSSEQATLSASQSDIRYKRARDIAHSLPGDDTRCSHSRPSTETTLGDPPCCC